MQKHHIGFFFSIFLLSAVIFSFWYFNPLQLWAQTGPPSYGCPQTSGEKKCTPDYALTSASSENPPCKTSAELKVLSDSCFASGGTGFNCGCQYPTPPGGDGGSCKKICSVVVDGNWRDTICAGADWTISKCGEFKNKVGAAFFQIGCLNENSISWGAKDGILPNPNCGWKRDDKLVFLTSGVYTGNLEYDGKKGIEAGDAICNAIGQTVRPTESGYRAWLSSSSTSPNTRFKKSSKPYATASGRIIASSYSDLTSKHLYINENQNGTIIGKGNQIWTGTSRSGDGVSGAQSAVNCIGWENKSSGVKGASALVNDSDTNYWSYGGFSNCESYGRLICFEQ